MPDPRLERLQSHLESRYGIEVTELATLDDCRDLPQALIHPDFVLANVIASPDRGMVLVDWAGVGRGPRLGSGSELDRCSQRSEHHGGQPARERRAKSTPR